VKALRFYDRRGLLPPRGRRPSGYRVYSESDLHRLEFIRQAKALGLTLDAIRDLVAAAREPGARVRPCLVRMLSERIAQTARQIATLTTLRMELKRRRRILAARHGDGKRRGYCTCLHRGQARVVLKRSKRGTGWSRLRANASIPR
jgi:DNA-binding transcriptional MerR regulator